MARELSAGAVAKIFDLSLPGFGFYLTHLGGHQRQAEIATFSSWLRMVFPHS
jgi:hypothetical protein